MKKISNWLELSKVPDSETHSLRIIPEEGNGWIFSKVSGGKGKDFYLSTHTFYGSTHKSSTKTLQEHGFDVELVSWD